MQLNRDPGSGWKGVRHHWEKIANKGGVAHYAPFLPQTSHILYPLTQNNNGSSSHFSYPPTDQVEMLAKAFNPDLRGAWLNSEHLQMMANEAQAAALGMWIWPKHDGHVHPNENMITYIENNNAYDSGKRSHPWQEPNGYAVVDAQRARPTYGLYEVPMPNKPLNNVGYYAQQQPPYHHWPSKAAWL